METEESESEEDGDERVEQKSKEGEILVEKDATGSGNEGETREDVEGEREGEQDMEGNMGSKEDLEGKVGEVNEEIADEEEESGEEPEEKDGEEKESVPFVEEEVEDREQEDEREAEIFLLDDITTDEQVTPIDERETRRHSRCKKKLDDEALASGARGLRLSDTEDLGEDIPRDQGNLAATKDISPEALETRYEEERKRKGKHAAKPQKKKPRQASTTVVIREATPEAVRVPFAHQTEHDEEQEGVDEETENPPKEGVIEKMEIIVTKRLLDAMVKFEDPKLHQACNGRAANGKLAKSGKSLCLSDLRDLGVEKKFISYFKSIGFEWLLDHCMEEVPVALAKEFFTSFKFKTTTDVDADSITFRLFNEELVMSIREWSLRMGLLTPEEDEEGAWNGREIGTPKDTEGFVAEEA